MPNYTELDHINPLLTDEERISRDATRKFVNKEIIPHITDWFADGEFPLHLASKMGELGMLGADLDLSGWVDDFRGQISHTGSGLMMQEFERADSGIRSFVSVHSKLGISLVLDCGSDEQKRTLLPPAYRGETIFCFALTEGHGGSDPFRMKTRVRQVSEGYLFEGDNNKVWITNGEIADWALVWARDLDEKDKSKQIKCFLIPKGTEGFSAGPMVDKKYKNSMRASITSYLKLENCIVPQEYLLPKADADACLERLTKARYGIDWGVNGAAYACFAEACEFVEPRELFKTPLGAKQLVQNRLAFMRCNIKAMQGNMYTLGRLLDSGKLSKKQAMLEVSSTKYFNPPTAVSIALEAERVLAAERITWEKATPRHLANLRSVETYEGTTDIHALIQGYFITKHKAF